MKKLLLVIFTIVVVIAIAVVVVASIDPVSLNCRRACKDFTGPAWGDCVLMCEEQQ